MRVEHRLIGRFIIFFLSRYAVYIVREKMYSILNVIAVKLLRTVHYRFHNFAALAGIVLQSVFASGVYQFTVKINSKNTQLAN